jgi:hypothetical protein
MKPSINEVKAMLNTLGHLVYKHNAGVGFDRKVIRVIRQNGSK